MKNLITNLLGGTILDFMKYKSLRKVYILFLIILVSIPLILNNYASPMFYEEIIHNIQDYAVDTVNHFDDTIKARKLIKKGNYDFNIIDEAAKRLKSDFSVYKLRIFNTEGNIFYSTDKSEISLTKPNLNPYFINDVKHGRIFSKIVKKKELSKEGQLVSKNIDVIEIYIPLMEDNNFIGSYEIYYDITESLKSFDKNGYKLFVVLSIFFIPLSMFIFFLIIRESVNLKNEEELKRELESKTQFLEKLYSSVQAGIIVVNKNTLLITKANDVALNILGFSEEELVGQKSSEFICEEQYSQILKTKRDVLSQKETYVCGKGSKIAVLMNTSLLTTMSKKEYIIHSFVDITDIKESELKLKKEFAFRYAIEKSINSGIMVINLEGIQTYVNPAFCSRIGFYEDELLNQKMPYKYWSQDKLEQTQNMFLGLLKGHFPPDGFEVKFEMKMGTHFHAHIIPSPLLDENNVMCGWVLSCNDVSEYRHVLIERDQMNSKLVNLAQMDELLKTSENLGESYEIIKSYIQVIFANTSGALVFANEKTNNLEVVTSWGEISFKKDFNPNKHLCIALRTGKAQFVEDGKTICIGKMIEDKKSYVCTPIKINGKHKGIIYLQHNVASYMLEQQKEMIYTVSEQIGSALTNIMLKNKLKEEAMRDQLTHLYNRRFMVEIFKKEIQHIKRYDGKISVLMLDIDHFKKVNDTYGHDCGDYVLSNLSNFLENFFRNSDTICRYGGEEILVIMPGSDVRNAYDKAEQLRKNISNQSFNYKSNSLEVRVSIGVTQYVSEDNSWEEIVKRADEALYEAKKTRNTVCIKVVDI